MKPSIQSADAASPDGVPAGRLWLAFALLGGAVFWLLHLLLAFVIAEFGCLLGLGTVLVGGLSVVAWALIAMSGFVLGGALSATWVSFRILKQVRDDETRTGTGAAPEVFTARTGLLSNVFFVFVILVQCVPIFYFLTDC